MNNFNNYRESLSEFEQKQKDLVIQSFLKDVLSKDKKYCYCSEDFFVLVKFDKEQ